MTRWLVAVQRRGNLLVDPLIARLTDYMTDLPADWRGGNYLQRAGIMHVTSVSLFRGRMTGVYSHWCS